MHPEAFVLHFPVLGDVPVQWYGILTLTGVLASILMARRDIVRYGILPREQALDACAVVAASSFIGGHVLFFLTPGQGGGIRIGSVLFGAILGGAAAVIGVARYHHIDLWNTLDAAAPAGVLPPLLGRFGCFMSGCCFGTPGRVPWAVTFTDPATVAPRGVPLHPTQLYEAAVLLGLFVLLLLRRRSRAFRGELALLYIGLYSAARFVIEYFRGDNVRGFVFQDSLSFSQAIAAVCLLAAGIGYISLWKRAKVEPA